MAKNPRPLHIRSALGLTATPKQDATVDTLAYFGTPVFTYSLREGIEDGYLAPYRVRRVVLSPDAEGWQPDPGQLDRFGRDIPEGVYSTRDFERVVSLIARTELAAGHLSAIFRRDPLARAMVFCVDQQHAEDVRAALVRHNPDLVQVDPEWVVRIVGSEPERVRLLDDFCDPDKDSPVIATTSRLLSTGVDVEDLKYVVLFRPVGSKVEFKQIIGRGTRLFPEKGKTSFEIVDYVGATARSSDPGFDGFPVAAVLETVDDDGEVVSEEVETPGPTDPNLRQTDLDVSDEDVSPEEQLRRRLIVDDGEFEVVVEAVLVADTSTGGLVLTEYGEYVAGQVRGLATDVAALGELWSDESERTRMRADLAFHGVDLDALLTDQPTNVDPFDVLVQVAWNVAPPTRSERVRRVRERYRTEMESQSAAARAVLAGLLDRYEQHGVDDMVSGEALSLPPLKSIGTPLEIAREFGGTAGFHSQLDELQRWLYNSQGA